jgi:predicted nucleic acid-binding protein
MRFVIDASTVGSFVLPDETTIHTPALEAFMLEAELVQPAHWPIEIAGLVVKASRRNRLTTEARLLARGRVGALIQSAEIEFNSAAIAAFDLAIAYHLSVYDAAYLELAIRRGLPLMTGDGALSKALPKAGVERVSLL